MVPAVFSLFLFALAAAFPSDPVLTWPKAAHACRVARDFIAQQARSIHLALRLVQVRFLRVFFFAEHSTVTYIMHYCTRMSTHSFKRDVEGA